MAKVVERFREDNVSGIPINDGNVGSTNEEYKAVVGGVSSRKRFPVGRVGSFFATRAFFRLVDTAESPLL